MAPRSIDEVLEALDAVVAWALSDDSRLGFFAAVYRKVTAKVKEGVDEGFFDDRERIERLDVVFANRYLDALAEFRDGRRPTRSWQLACEAAARWRPIILQHLLVGINAHINLDLGIAAAHAAPGAALAGLRRDFDRVNEILASLVRQIQEEIGEVSPWIALLDLVGGRGDEEVVKFSMEVARTKAWGFATELAPLPPDQWAGPIRARDTGTARLTGVILNPGPLNAALLVVRSRESNDPGRVIEVLRRVQPPPLAVVEARVRQDRALGD